MLLQAARVIAQQGKFFAVVNELPNGLQVYVLAFDFIVRRGVRQYLAVWIE